MTDKHTHKPAISPDIRALSVRLPSSMHQELRKLAFETENSLNQIIIKAIKEYLKQVKKTR